MNLPCENRDKTFNEDFKKTSVDLHHAANLKGE